MLLDNFYLEFETRNAEGMSTGYIESIHSSRDRYNTKI